jgi:hypothetical protein
MAEQLESRPGRLRARLALETRDEERARKYSEALEALGFAILQVTARGVSFEGETEQFETTFKAKPESKATGYGFSAAPEMPEALRDEGVSLYFPTPPVHFGSGGRARQGRKEAGDGA